MPAIVKHRNTVENADLEALAIATPYRAYHLESRQSHFDSDLDRPIMLPLESQFKAQERWLASFAKPFCRDLFNPCRTEVLPVVKTRKLRI